MVTINRTLFTSGLLAFSIAFISTVPRAVSDEPEPPGLHDPVPARGPALQESTLSERTAGRLEIGFRYIQISLNDTDRSAPGTRNYLGSIDRLNEKQPRLPYPFINYHFQPNWGISLAFDRFGAETIKTVSRNESDTDGTIYVRGPVLSLRGRYPNESRLTPFCEAGLAYYFGKFAHDHQWRHVGASRIMDINDTVAVVLAAGMDVGIYGGWSLQLYARYNNAKVKGTYTRDGLYMESATLPLKHFAYGIGTLYSF